MLAIVFHKHVFLQICRVPPDPLDLRGFLDLPAHVGHKVWPGLTVPTANLVPPDFRGRQVRGAWQVVRGILDLLDHWEQQEKQGAKERGETRERRVSMKINVNTSSGGLAGSTCENCSLVPRPSSPTFWRQEGKHNKLKVGEEGLGTRLCNLHIQS